jgi:hypothetical protein
MGDIKDRRVLYLKGILFVVLGLMASTIIVLENPSWRLVVLLGVAIWAFARAYYFAFYVLQHYVDDGYKFAGLISFLRYCVRRRR